MNVDFSFSNDFSDEESGRMVGMLLRGLNNNDTACNNFLMLLSSYDFMEEMRAIKTQLMILSCEKICYEFCRRTKKKKETEIMEKRCKRANENGMW